MPAITAQWDKAWINTHLLTMTQTGARYGLIENAAIACNDGKIAWLGSMHDFTLIKHSSNLEIIDAANRFISPGLIDCHTHLIYAGNRALEFEQRLNGISYQTIARQGGGILSTVKATRAASEEFLYTLARNRIQNFIDEGVTTMEIKSGYGLNLETEVKMLQVAKRLQETLPLTIIPTFLGAHSLPTEYVGDADSYVDKVCNEMLPIIAEKKLATAVDGFCEKIAFNRAQISKIFTRAKQLHLNIKLHADQLSNSNSAKLAAEFGALSADHLEYSSEESIKAMAKNNTVAVLLPGAYYYLGETQKPPIDLLRKHKVTMAIASDSNPGSSPVLSLLSIINMACILFGLTPEEALLGVTRNAACALGIGDQYGTLETGKQADFVLWDIQSPAELAYSLGHNPCFQVVRHGECRTMQARLITNQPNREAQ